MQNSDIGPKSRKIPYLFLILSFGIVIIMIIAMGFYITFILVNSRNSIAIIPLSDKLSNRNKAIDYSLQKYQFYDDWRCVGNNSIDDYECAEGDYEYTGEEGEWASSTDTDISNISRIVTTLQSGIVMQDLRTGLYWSDTIGLAELKYDYCKQFMLDADGDGIDEDGWRMPTQQELMKAYINGAANNLTWPYIYWSSTPFKRPPLSGFNTNGSDDTSYMWAVSLYDGETSLVNRISKLMIRCVHE